MLFQNLCPVSKIISKRAAKLARFFFRSYSISLQFKFRERFPHVLDRRNFDLLSPTHHVAEVLAQCPNVRPETLGSPKKASVRLHIPSFSSLDRKSTRLNSSHGYISYAVFCLKKKKTTPIMSENH